MRSVVLIGLAAMAIPLGSGSDAETLSAGENYALLVGVGDYDVKELRPLKYTRADVLALHERLLASGFDAENVVLMHDDLEKLVAHYRKLGPQFKPQRYLPLGGNVRTQLKLLLGRLRRDDSVVVAFSGHGVQFRNEKTSYFCPADAKLEKKDSLIAFGDVFAALKDSQASRRLLLVDACQNDPLTLLAKSRQTVDLESTTRPQDASVPEGIIALFSCRAGQKSFEMPELGHGVFFHHLLEAWDGKGDLNEDGKLSYLELAAYTRRETAEYAAVKLQALQTPQLKADFSGDWILRELAMLPTRFDSTKKARTAVEAKASQEAWAKHLGTKVVKTNSIGMKLALIPAGEFLMGSTPGEADEILKFDSSFKKEYADDERSPHRVRITQPFYLGAHEVTLGQFRQFVNATGYQTEAEKDGEGGYGWNEADGKFEGRDVKYNWKNTGFTYDDDHPVVNVSWNDAVAFCEWLSRKEEAEYQLPTEAQWEYTARGGTETMWWHGDAPEGLARVANVADATAKAKWSNYQLASYIKARDGYVFTAPVGSYRANPFGLYDMHGNVWEWCSDLYDAKSYEESRQEDPAGPKFGSFRVRRGGCWGSSAGFCRSASREWNSPSFRLDYLGFRVAHVASGN